MNREVYTYTDLTKLDRNKDICKLKKYPQISVSTDLIKCWSGTLQPDMVTTFHGLASAIDEDWNTDQSKFNEMVILSEFMREKLEKARNDDEQRNWLIGCMRNLDSMLSSIALLEMADVKPDDIDFDDDKNLGLFVEAWNRLIDRDPVISRFRSKMRNMVTRDAWKSVFKTVFNINLEDEIDSVVFHGFYYITPHQERIMKLLETAGFKLIFLIPYDERFPYVYEIWNQTYAIERGYKPKNQWKLEKASDKDVYGELFEGKPITIPNKLVLKEYSSIMEFVDDVKHIKENGFSIYSADHKTANEVLVEYFPEAYGERKILSYPIGQFINVLNKMWDEDKQTIAMDEAKLIECFSSGWLAVDGISGKRYMQDLIYVLPFFKGCFSLEEWEERIALFNEIKQHVISPFEMDLDADTLISRWQETIGSPLKNFSMFAVPVENLEIILKLINQIFKIAKELFGSNEKISIQDHIRKLDVILKKYELSEELYKEEKNLVTEIFEKLCSDNDSDILCYPSDIAKALDLFICGKMEEGEIQTNKSDLVNPFYLIDAACVKNKGKVHICLCDVDRLPGRNKDYIWPLTGKKIKEIYNSTKNSLLLNLIQIMESTVLCNRYFTYCALKNKVVTLSWINTIGERMFSPSPYIKLLSETAGMDITPSARNAITYERVVNTPMGLNRIKEYCIEKAPIGMIKEARMDYALCPMKYILGYVVEKFPTYQSDFQMNYTLNAFISAIYGLMKEEGMKVNQIYDELMILFPNMRKAEKRQIYDYISYERSEDEMDYGNRTECGGKYYTDQRIKLHYPDQEIRKEAWKLFGKLNTPDGRKGMNLYEVMDAKEKKNICTLCQHVSYCRNALYVGKQEKDYD